MKKHLINTTIALFSLLCCTACFDIQEHLFLKKDGSGNFSFVIDLSQMKSMMALFNEPADSEGHKTKPTSPNETLNAQFESTRDKLLKIPGITEVKAIEDTVNFKFGVNFNFKNIESLNKAMNKLFEDDSVSKGTKDIVYFEMKDHQLIRNDAMDSKSIMGKSVALSNTKGVKSQNPTSNMDQLFSTVSYSTSYEFENKIDSTQNMDAVVSSNQKTVTLKCYPFTTPKDSTQKKCSIANIITLNKRK